MTINTELENDSDILGYAIFTNDKFNTFTTEKILILEDTLDNIIEKITVLAIDKNYNTEFVNIYPERTKKKFVYLKGTKEEEFTRSWVDTVDVIWNNEYIRYNVNAEKPGVGYRTANKIDLSNYSKLCFYYEGYKNYGSGNIGSFGYSQNILSAYNFPKNSSYIGAYIPYSKYNGVKIQKINENSPSSYIYFKLYGWTTINIYGIWLE